MSKITTDFAGTETLAVTKTRLESILTFWLGLTALSGVSTWGNVRTLLNSIAPTLSPITDNELASSFRPKLNALNETDTVISTNLFSSSEQGVWFDPSPTTCFTDTAGTTPAQVGQAVALMLDKSKGLVLGPDVVVNGGFDTDTDWTKGAGWTISGGVATKDPATGGSPISQTLSGVPSGRFVKVLITVIGATAGGVLIRFGSTANQTDQLGNGTHEVLVSNAGDNALRVQASATFNGSIDNISVRELAGNHATQSILASRPTLARVPANGRRNLLTRTEEFDNAVWVKAGNGVALAPVVTPNVAVAPDGTMTADLVAFNLNGGSSTGDRSEIRLFLFIFNATTYVSSFYIKAATSGDVGKTVRIGTDGITPAQNITLTADYQRVGQTATSGNTSANYRIEARGTFNDDQVSVHIWGAQLELGSTATAYQKVSSTFDVTEAGVPDNFSLSFDGIDDSMSTPSIDFTGTDKMTVFAGVRKLSDAARGTIAELSATIASNNGAFHLTAPNAASSTYAFESKGTNLTDAVGSATAPVSSILVGIGDISGDNTTLRINAVQADQDTGDQGTGNYGNYPLFIGSRAGTSLRLNGQLYSLIVRGAQTDLALIQSTERYAANRTAGVSL